MKKVLIYLLLIVTLTLTGCQSAEEKKKAEMMEAFENMGVEYSAVIQGVLAKEWKVLDGEAVYTFTKEGTGDISGETFTYTCGVNEDNKIMTKLTMDESKEEIPYFLEMDDTGHGVLLISADGEKLHLLKSDVTLLDMTDERAIAMVGEWADKSDNRYILNDDFTVVIKGSSAESEGTFSAAERDGKFLVTLVISDNILEFYCDIAESQNSVNLQVPETDVVHTWIRK